MPAKRAAPRSKAARVAAGTIRVGIGGWVYAPWRDNFYPAGLVQKDELAYASRHVTAIEVNGTWYGAQKPHTYAAWRDATPDGFVFAAKAPRRITMARNLAGTGGAIADFVGGIATLGPKLGPIVWQFDPGRPIDRDAFARFLELLPGDVDGRRVRHALDVREPSFVDAGYVALARAHGMATVFTDSDEHPSFADLGADFAYARLMRSEADRATGYALTALRRWAGIATRWARGEDPVDLPHLAAPAASPSGPRDVFVFFIASAKERNPAAAMALLAELAKAK